MENDKIVKAIRPSICYLLGAIKYCYATKQDYMSNEDWRIYKKQTLFLLNLEEELENLAKIRQEEFNNIKI